MAMYRKANGVQTERQTGLFYLFIEQIKKKLRNLVESFSNNSFCTIYSYFSARMGVREIILLSIYFYRNTR